MPVRLIPNKNLRVGMQTVVPNPRGGYPRYLPDKVLTKFFITSRRFPHIAFQTLDGGKVVYSPCSSTYILFD